MATEFPNSDVVELAVREVVIETADARSIVFEPYAGWLDFKPGQFLTLAVPSDQTGVAARCYSLSSTPGEGLKVTVKRTADGYASNWICENLEPGDSLRVLPPSGIFTPASLDADFLLFAGGSGVTPIMSIARTALRNGSGRIVVFYANRDESSVIFAKQWAELAAAYPDRLQVVHWLESVQGLPSQDQLRAFASQYLSYDAFVCGPAPFMASTVAALRELEFPRERRHQEKFISLGGNPFGDAEDAAVAAEEIEAAESDGPGEVVLDDPSAGPSRLQVELDGVDHDFDDWAPGVTLLDHLESKGIAAPYSCRLGECSACACRILEGEVKMLNNDVLDDEDLADGIRLACQSVAVTDKVRVSYS
ncbi:oxidoreductase [Nocardioides baekrokdamisoli]|uniref:Oxidoreductase n=1 Tax=Nocardioides baekrokdamisoli TaxID=1804624 RepID=A0A3G9IJN8_9ACTN|nr:ferredoxin--NADP reductase [Nocardioides baekrokdamisoli]BBH18506.1 oxidoreductase [Nocardioides baekrokdamisoli]